MSFTTSEKTELRKPLQRHEKDVGSSEVQVGLLTERIKYLTEHFKEHKQDLHSKYGLLHIVNRRKKLLKYLKQKDQPGYSKLISQLGLRDSY